MLKRLLKEPLLHFLVLALIIFAAYDVMGRQEEKTDRIVVTAARIEQLGSLFAATWERPPSAQEMQGLIDDYVKEEIYYRAAKKLGLDIDDSVIRRRLHLKMEFLSAAMVDSLTPSDADLESYLKANPAKFEMEPEIAFRQIFLSPDVHGDKIDQDARATLVSLEGAYAVDPTTRGDPTLLPGEMPLTGKTAIARTFGTDFADALDKAIPGQWSGPVSSSFGYHIVRVSAREAGRVPALADVREAVLREWANDRRREFEDQRFNELLKRYEVVIDKGSAKTANP